MRTYFIYIFIFLINQNLLAQQENYFPLAIGNQYQDYNGFSYFYGEIERDTTYSSGKTYFSLPGVFEFGDTRVDSIGNVYTAIVPFTGAVSENGESLIFKESADVGEIWPVAWNFGSPIIDTLYAELLFSEIMPVFGTLREVRSILLYENEGPPYIFWLAKGIGKIREIYDDGTIADLNYAKIGNKIYGTLVSVEDEPKLINSFELFQNYPNPFNPTTTIKFSLVEPQKVKLTVYSLLGEEIKVLLDEYKSTGNFTVNFNAIDLSSGVYIYRIQAGDFIKSRKMLLTK